MKKLISILLIPLFLVSFSACGKSKKAEGQNVFGDFNNTFAYNYAMSTAAESEDAIYWRSYTGKYIHYYDKKTGESGVLCPKPECVHDAVLDNTGCSGYVVDCDPCMSFYNGRLYFKNRDPLGGRRDAIMSVAADGTDLKKEFSVPAMKELGGSPVAFFLHRDALFILVFVDEVDGALPDWGYRIVRLSPKNEEMETVFEKTTTLHNQCHMRFRGDRLYICLSEYTSMEGAVFNGFYYWDENTGKLNTVLETEHESGSGMFIDFGFYVDEKGTIYFSPNRTVINSDESGVVYKVENGELKEAFRIEIPGLDHFTVNIGNDAAVVMYNYEFWVYDLNGDRVFRGGPTYLDFLGEYGLNRSQIAHEHGYYCRDYMIESIDGTNAHNMNYEFMVKYDFTDDGLVTTLLGSEIVE